MADEKEKATEQPTQKPSSGKEKKLPERDLGKVSGGLNPQPLPPLQDRD